MRPLVTLAAVLLAGQAVADEHGPLTVPDLTGPRGLALQSGVGSASGTEALFANPAALAARRRYSFDTFYLTDRRPDLSGSARRQDYLGAAIADSSTTKLAAGFGYVRASHGVETGTLMRLALAGQVAQGLYAGLQGNYFDLRGAERVASTLNLDAGLFYRVTRMVSVGGSAYNLLSSHHRDDLPQGYGVGAAVGSETSLQVVGDWRVDRDRDNGKDTNRYSVGAEYLLNGAFPVRAGYQVDGLYDTRWWSAGLGWVSARVAVDLGYRQNVQRSDEKTIAVALRVFFPSE